MQDQNKCSRKSVMRTLILLTLKNEQHMTGMDPRKIGSLSIDHRGSIARVTHKKMNLKIFLEHFSGEHQ